MNKLEWLVQQLCLKDAYTGCRVRDVARKLNKQNKKQ